jgi:glutathione S-transferase
MHELILHHYPTSPFAEKARLMLGFKQLSWRSVMIPPVMPSIRRAFSANGEVG